MTTTGFSNMGPGLTRERFNLTYKDCTAAALTQTFTLKAVPKGTVVLGAVVQPRTAFSGGGIGSCTLKVGFTAGATDTIVDASDIAAAVADTTVYNSGSNAAAAPFMATKAADNITATITTTTTNVSTMTAGSVDIDVFYWMTEDLTATGPVGNSLLTGGF
jgi:hypothetical protein